MASTCKRLSGQRTIVRHDCFTIVIPFNCTIWGHVERFRAWSRWTWCGWSRVRVGTDMSCCRGIANLGTYMGGCSDVNPCPCPCPCRSSPWQVLLLNLACNTHSIVLMVIYLFCVMGFTVICCEFSLCVHSCCLIAIVGLAATCSK